MGSSQRSSSLLGRRSLEGNGSRLTDPLGLGTPLYRFRLSGRNRHFNRNSLCGSRSSRSHSLSHHINPIKETLHGCAYDGKNLLSRRVIYGDKLGLNLKNVKQKQKKKKKRKGEKCIIIDDAKRRGDGEMGQSMTHGNGNRCKKGREKKR